MASCTDGGTVVGATDPDFTRHAPPRASRIPADGTFQANVDFTTLTVTPRGRNCALEVDGQLVFSGTIEGVATGTTTALVLAPCSEVLSYPPGSFADVFRSEFHFSGTVAGEAVEARGVYQGRVQPGGAIGGRILLSGGAQGVLTVEAVVAVGGTYEGAVVIR